MAAMETMTMRLTAALVTFGVITLAAGSVSAQDKTIDHAMKVYADQKCALCHAIGGKGNAKGPLDEVGSKLTPDVIRQWIVNPIEMAAKANATRKPPMKAMPNLAKDDVDALVTYLSTLKKK